jgi:hypothetical protein
MTQACRFSFTSNNTNIGDIVTVMRMVYDGINLWAIARVRGQTSGEYYPAFVRLNTNWGYDDGGASAPSMGTLENYVMSVYALDDFTLQTAGEATCKGPIAYDGQHLYTVNIHPLANAMLHRLPQALLR